MRRRKAVIFFVFSFCVSIPLVFSYNYTGYKWNSNPSYYINQDLDTDVCPGAESAVIRAAATWSNVSNQSFRLSWAASTDLNYNPSGHDGFSVVGYWIFPDNRVGDTKAWYVGSGQIIECDTAFNTYYLWSASLSDLCPWDRMDVQNVATHEFGHWLRLGNVGDYNATMCEFTEKGETKKRSLESDDMAGIRHIYGSGGGEKRGSGCGLNPAVPPEDDEIPEKKP
ncbi:MAG: matrixin family metalloprotease [Candidatus Eisenbacteria bacterium]|nr:matrixin family metalloprotease [Candidatus Eisenbacteria bacterium]